METSSTKRIDTLNILRVLALFLTFVSHSYLFDSQVFAAGIITFPFAAPAWACMWVLFTLSGYLAGRGFALERYSLTWDGVKKYYLGRLFKIWMPTVLFIFLTALFVYPDFLFGDSTLIFRCVPLSFTPIGGPDGIGATWFVFTIMWLYLLTPLFCWASKRLSQKGRFIGIVIVVFGGLGYRLLMSHFVQNYWQDYLNYIYLPPVGNLDFYVAGILAAHREKREKRREEKRREEKRREEKRREEKRREEKRREEKRREEKNPLDAALHMLPDGLLCGIPVSSLWR